MESVIPEDSPLAAYLEGTDMRLAFPIVLTCFQGTADDAASSAPKTPESPVFFAPRGLPGRTRLAKLQESIPPLKFQSKKAPSPPSARRSRRYSVSVSLQAWLS
jgi:hypothetical protein